MAQLALGLVGAVIGSPGVLGFGAGLGFSIGSVLGSFLFPGPGRTIEGPRLTDLRVQTSSYGEPIVEPYGTLIISGNMIWATDIEEVRTESSSGGKGSPSVTTVSYTYFGKFAVGLSTAVSAITRIWADAKIIYDVTDDNTGPISRFADNIRIYTGGETQLPDPAIEADKGTGIVPSHRGLAYVVFDRFPLADFANHIPNIACEVTTNATTVFAKVDVPIPEQSADISFSHDNRFFYFQVAPGGDAKLQRVDIVNNRAIDVTVQVPIDGFSLSLASPLVDENGDAYYNMGDFPPDSRMACYRAPGYGLEKWSHANAGFDSSGAMAIGGPVLSRVIYGQENVSPHKFIIHDIDVLAENDIVKRIELNLESIYGHNNRVTSLRVDENGHCWTCYFQTATSPDEVEFFLIDEFGGVIERIKDTSGALEGIGDFLYLADQRAFLVRLDDGDLVKWDIATNSELGRLTNVAASGIGNRTQFRQGVISGHVYPVGPSGDGLIRKIDVAAMEVVETWDPTDWSSTNFNNHFYDPHAHAIWHDNSFGGDWEKLLLDRETTGTVTLQSIVDDRLGKAGLSPSDYDTSALAGEIVRGYAVTGRMPERRAIEPLAQAFFWDLVESDFQLKAVNRGAAPVASITEADLAAHEFAAEPPAELIETRAQEIELPERIDLNYINPATNYETGTQHAKRISEAVSTKRAVTMDLPIVLTDDEAKRIVERTLFLLWLERESFEISLSQKWLRLDPADVITVSADGITRDLLIKEVDDGANLIRRIRAVADDDIIYQSTAAGAASEAPTDTLIVPGPTEFELIDSPLFRDSDDGPGFYIAAGGYDDNWPGAVIYLSEDASHWAELTAVLSGAEAVIGGTTDALADGPTTIFDGTNSVTVQLIRGALASATKLQVLNGSNACLIGNEIIQFRDAVQQGDGSWALSGLLRGRRGTEWATGTHATGDRFILLELGRLSRIGSDLGQIGLKRFYRAVTLSDPIETAVVRSFIDTGRALKPYAPVHIKGSRDGSNNLTITWVRRTRVGGAWRDNVGVPLGEASESYEVDIVGTARTIAVTTEIASYAATQQNDDGLTPGDPVTVNIYQLSADIGRGFAGIATI